MDDIIRLIIAGSTGVSTYYLTKMNGVEFGMGVLAFLVSIVGSDLARRIPKP